MSLNKTEFNFFVYFPGDAYPFSDRKTFSPQKILEILGINLIYDFYKDDKLLLD